MATLRGTPDDDELIGTDEKDEILGLGGNDFIDGQRGADVLRGGAGNDVVIGGLGADRIFAGAGDDFIDAGAGNDIIDTGDGFDFVLPGAGDDVIDSPAGFIGLSYEDAPGGVTVDLAAGTADDGFGGSDRFTGVVDTLVGSDFDDTLRGGGNDEFEAFEGRAGDDLIDGGGGGDDEVRYQNDPAGVIVDLRAGTATDGFGDTDTLIGINRVRGSAFGDTLLGTDDGDLFRPQAGDDQVDGRGGDDEVDYRNDPAGVRVDLASGTATDGFGDTDTLVSIERIRGSEFDDTLSGADGVRERFRGRGGDDVIDGGAGGGDRADYSDAPAGTDINLQTGQAEDGFGGTDTLSGIEQVRGSSFDDVIIGTIDNVEFESFEGLAGNDVIDGGNAANGGAVGNDGVFYGDAPDGIVANLATGRVEDGFGTVDTVSNIETLGGSNLDDVLIGGNAANDGYEEFQGLAGNDQIDGGSGFDRVAYQFDGGTGPVTVNLATGQATDSHGDSDTLAGIESVSGTELADSFTGSGAAFEQFRPLGGDDRIDGRGGIDQVDYGRSPGGVVVDLRAGTAADGHGSTDALSGVEWIRGSGFDDRITGSGAANRLEGGDGRDVLAGLAGADELDGGLGRDTLSGGAGVDLLSGGGGPDRLEGGRGADTLDGGAGDDLLVGGPGDDDLTGGAGADTFRFTAASQGIDTIADLDAGDVIDLAEVLAGFDDGVSDPADFVNLVDSGADAILQVDADGGADDFRDLAVISGAAGTTTADLLAAGNLVLSDGATS